MSAEIHPTAVIDPAAELGDDVEIGPHCVVGAGVKLGSGCRLHNHVSLAGPTEIGSGNEFYPFASIGRRTQDLKNDGEPTWLKIGDGNTFREFVTINRATSKGDATVIGNHGSFLAYSHVGHDCIVGDHVIFSNNGTLGGHVTAEDYVIISGLSAVHQFCRLGESAFTGGCSKIVQDIPPFMIADGNPAKVRAINVVGMQRRGYDEAGIRMAKRSHRLLYRSDLTTSNALEELRKLDEDDDSGVVRKVIDFVEGSERGIH